MANPDILQIGAIAAVVPPPVNSAGVPNVDITGQKATYSTSILGLVIAASATDIFTLTGSASKVVKINRILISGSATAAAAADCQLIKRSTADTGGTSTTPVIAPNDSANAAATAVANAYTVNPAALGTSVGAVRAQKLDLVAVTGAPIPLLFGFNGAGGQPIALRGVTQQLCVNLNGVTYAGGLIDVDIEWTEE